MASGIRRRELAQQELENSDPTSEGEEGAKTKYRVGARVLCYEPDSTKAKMLYNARVLDMRETKKRAEGKEIEYLMHFVGWSSNWDCWVEEKSILLDDSTGREIQKRTNRLANRSMKKDDMFRVKVAVTKGKKRQRKFHDSDEDSDNDNHHVTSTRYSSKDSDISDSDCSTSTSTEQSQPKSKPQGKSSQMRHQITLNLPSALKAVLTEDMHKIELGLLLRLPRSPNVLEILSLYFQEKIQAFPDQQGIYGEIVDGVKVYFDFMVGDQLLYESELHQFKCFFPQKGNKPLLIACSPDYIQYAPITRVEIPIVMNKERATKSTPPGTFQKPSRRSLKEKECQTLPSQVYGIEHLARLFVHLPDFLKQAEIPRRHNSLLRSHLQDLLDYITLNLPRYQETQHYEEPRTQSRKK